MKGSGPGAQAPEAMGEDNDGPVLKRNAQRVQRSARPIPAQKTADLGINLPSTYNGKVIYKMGILWKEGKVLYASLLRRPKMWRCVSPRW
jgi:hypothetical protein